MPTFTRPRSVVPLFISLVVLGFLAAFVVSSPPPVEAVSTTLVVSQIYGAGGNSGSTLKNDFIEIFNRGAGTVSIAGWSVQYGAATGTTWQVTNLSGSIAPGQYYLVQEGTGGAGTVGLPTPDATGTINMAAGAGKVALVNSTT